jgi:hypothetical protein
MYLTTDTLYLNTKVGLNSLLTAIKSGSTTLTPTTSGITSLASFTVPNSTYTYLYLVWDLRLKPLSLICQKIGSETTSILQEACCDCSCTATNTEYRIRNNSSTTLTITYQNTSGAKAETSLAGGLRDITICSQQYPRITPPSSDVTVIVTDCDCS